jgi:cation-transporting ATPase E
MAIQGLSESEVIARRQRGLGNNIRLATSRSYTDILRQNVLIFINIVLFVIGAVLISVGRIGDAVVSVGLILMNIVIGVYQEARAKRQLDKIALLTRPKAA